MSHNSTDRQTDRQRDRQTDRQTERQTDRQTERQTDRERERGREREKERESHTKKAERSLRAIVLSVHRTATNETSDKVCVRKRGGSRGNYKIRRQFAVWKQEDAGNGRTTEAARKRSGSEAMANRQSARDDY